MICWLNKRRTVWIQHYITTVRKETYCSLQGLKRHLYNWLRWKSRCLKTEVSTSCRLPFFSVTAQQQYCTAFLYGRAHKGWLQSLLFVIPQNNSTCQVHLQNINNTVSFPACSQTIYLPFRVIHAQSLQIRWKKENHLQRGYFIILMER